MYLIGHAEPFCSLPVDEGEETRKKGERCEEEVKDGGCEAAAAAEQGLTTYCIINSANILRWHKQTTQNKTTKCKYNHTSEYKFSVHEQNYST